MINEHNAYATALRTRQPAHGFPRFRSPLVRTRFSTGNGGREQIGLGRHGGERGGFSLVEVLAALVIIGVIASTLLVILNNSIREARVAKNTRTAWQLAQQKYSELKNAKPSSLSSASGSFPEHEKFRWKTRVREHILKAEPPPDAFDDPSKERERRRIYRVQLIVTYPGDKPDDREQIQLSMIRLPSVKKRNDTSDQ